VAATARVRPDDLLAMVTTAAASVLRDQEAGRIRVGAPADLTIIPAAAGSAGEALLRCRRADVALVLRRGTPLFGDPSLAGAFGARGIHVRRVEVDGHLRLMQTSVVRRIERCLIAEPGVKPITGF